MAYESVGGGEEPGLFNPDATLDASRVSDSPQRRISDQANTGRGPQMRALASTASSSDWTEEQRQNAAIIAKVGRQLGASDRDIQVALMAAIVESGLRNLNYGDRDSIGMFQQRDAWGSAAARLNPYSAARMFFLGGMNGQRGLLDLTNRNSLSMGQAAQAIQVSAFPDRYAQHEAEAGALLGSIGGTPVPPEAPGEVTLGSVPGIEESIQSPVGAPVQPTTTEVDGLGEITADESGIGALTFDTEGGPLGPLEFGQAAVPQQSAPSGSQAPSGASQAPSGGSASAPVGHNHMSDLMIETPAGPGEVFAGSFEGKNPYDLTQWDGETVDYLTAAALEAAKREFGNEFRIMQGSHSDEVAASGGTHHGGGVVDLSVPNGDWEGAVTALRKIGFAAWVRNVDGYGQAGSGAHIHAVLMGNEELSPQAQIQVQSYLNNDDGLAGSRADDSTREFVNNRFTWGDAEALAQKKQRQGNNAAVRRTMKLVGLPHKWGGKDYEGLDGEGLVRMVFEQEGTKLPKHILDMVATAPAVPVKEMVEGDMIVWDSHPEWGTPHLGIYMGSGLYAEVRPGGQVQVSEMAMAPAGYQSVMPPRPVETGSGLNQPVRSYDATPGGMVRPPSPAPVAPYQPPKPPKSKNPAPGGHVADGFV